MKAIITKYHPATNTRGARISATDEDGNRVRVPYEYNLDGEAVHRTAVVALCHKMGWSGRMAYGGTPTGYVYVWVCDGDVFTVPRVLDEVA